MSIFSYRQDFICMVLNEHDEEIKAYLDDRFDFEPNKSYDLVF